MLLCPYYFIYTIKGGSIMTTVCGLDFGTSNSTIGINQGRQAHLIPFENSEFRLRSSIFYHTERHELIFGENGVTQYLKGEPGRLMMSLKSLLGSSLLQDETLIGNQLVPYAEILGEFIRYLKQKAEEKVQEEILQVVMGRPVVFHVDPNKDLLAEKTLESIVKKLGFQQVIFQYEPLAAGFAYENNLMKEELVLVVDMGGGTSDFSVIRLGAKHRSIERTNDILANYGVRIGGADLDKRLSLMLIMPILGMYSLMKGSSSDIEVPNAIYHDLTSWHLLRKCYSKNVINDVHRIYQLAYEKPLIKRLIDVLQNQEGHRILDSVERGKKQLSDMDQIDLDVSYIEAALSIPTSQQQFNHLIADYRLQILEAIDMTLKKAGVEKNAIQALFYTGGTTKVPIIRQEITRVFPQAKVIEGDIFGSVGMGLTLDAINRWIL